MGVLCPNDELEVNYLLERLDLRSVADSLLKITILPFTSKKGELILEQNDTVLTMDVLYYFAWNVLRDFLGFTKCVTADHMGQNQHISVTL